ncbi:hypothetical protein VN1349_14720 [Helicobacter pylori]|nr:hypothetical protein VN1263_10040 [Helicobacter pylori]
MKTLSFKKREIKTILNKTPLKIATTQAKVNVYCQKRDYHSLNELKAFAKDLIKSYLNYKA